MERTIQNLKDLLRACVLEFGGKWEDYVTLVEFTYNNSHQTTIGMASFEALYWRKYCTIIYWEEVDDKKLLGFELVQINIDKVKMIKERMKMAWDK